MDFDFQWLLMALPVAFGLGWIASRLDLRQLKQEERETPRAYFKGLSLLLNEQQDKAVDAFIQAVRADPDTVELHFALGSLFRRRGEFERAIRIHEHLLSRADLQTTERDRAQYGLAQDFLRAGLFDRAETAYRALEGSAYAAEARLALLNLYERSRDWPAAITTAQALEVAGQGAFSSRIAHFYCELAHVAQQRGQTTEAMAHLASALSVQPHAARALMMQAQFLTRQGLPLEAFAAWTTLMNVQPERFALSAMEYAQCAVQVQAVDRARQALETLHQTWLDLRLLKAWLWLGEQAGTQSPGSDEAANAWAQQLERRPSLSAAEQLLLLPHTPVDDRSRQALQNALRQAGRPLQRYRCAACGFEAQHYFWQCPGCLNWDSFPAQTVEQAT